MPSFLDTKHQLIAALAILHTLFFVTIYIGLGTFLYPILAAILLVYLSLPAIEFLKKTAHFPAIVAVGVLFLLQLSIIITLFFIALPYLIAELATLIKHLPTFINYFFEEARTLASSYEIPLSTFDLPNLSASLNQAFASIAKLNASTLQTTLSVAGGTAGQLLSPVYWMAYILIIPLIYFFLALNAAKIIPMVKKYTPLLYRQHVINALTATNTIFSGYFRGQITVVFFLCILYSSTLSLLGIPYAVITGILTGILSFIPYLGFVTGFIISTFSLFYSNASLFGLLSLVLGFACINAVESLFLTPTFMGKRIGMSNLASLLSLIIGANLFGAFGLIFAIPLAATCKHFFLEFTTYCKQQEIL